MGEPTHANPPAATPSEGRLDSWKEIAAYLNRDVTTVQRWEKREGMPVHRHQHDKKGSVYAYRSELDIWARTRNLRADPEADTTLSAGGEPLQRLAHPKRWRWVTAAAAIAVVIAAIVWLQRTEYFWRSPIANARFQPLTDFGGVEQAAAISRDGRMVAFLSDRDGPVDVWVTQVGSGEFHNLTRGSAPELVNNSVRTLGFSPDGSVVTYWVRKPDGSSTGDISIWAVPTLGGQPRPYLEGVAEYDWSRDGSRLAYHTPGPGDPLFVSNGDRRPESRPIFVAPEGVHNHFPVWAPDGDFLYFVQGSLPDKLDIWRISPEGGNPQRVTALNTIVSYPVFLNRRTLLFLASDRNGSGPFLYSMDTGRHMAHRLSSGAERYTSLSASADGRRLALTLARPARTLWRLQLDRSLKELSTATPIALTTTSGFSPRLGPNYLLYVSATGKGESIWRLLNGSTTELWSGEGARVVGGPAVSRDGQRIAFSVLRNEQTLLYVMQSDGTNARVVSASLPLQGDPVWSPDGRSIITAALNNGLPRLFRVPLDGGSPSLFVNEYAVNPVCSPDDRFVIYSGPDVGTTFSVKAVTAEGAPYSSPLTLTRGARHLAFIPGGRAVMFMKGDIQRKDLWLLDLETGAERELVKLLPDFDIRDFDLAPDGRELVLERVQERSEIVMMDLPLP